MSQPSSSMLLRRLCRLGSGTLILAATCLAQTKSVNPNAPLNSADQALAQAQGDDAARDLSVNLQKFVDVLTAVKAESADDVPVDKLIYEGAIPSMLRQLDPHTQFFDPGQFDQLKHMEQSEQKGFGSVVSVLPGQVIFLQTLPGTPSNKAGIMPGDHLVAINNVAIASLDGEQIVGLLTEAKQQAVTLFVRRQGAVRVLAFNVKPELVDAPSVDRAYLLTPGIGYIRVTSWDLETGRQLRAAIEKLGGNNLQGLVLDLRDNPGGVVKAALEGASLFLAPGQRILTARGRTGEGETADVPSTATPYHFRMAVLVNEKTASASEILSGALQDHDRATIIGEPSYGKGLVQSVLPLASGAGLALTTAFYYTPSGRSIQRPLRNSALSTTFSGESDAARPTYVTDGGRAVTGGGGIQPDIHVPSRKTYSRFESVLQASGALIAFATEYLQAHNPLPDLFEVTPALLDEFQVFLSQHQIQPNVAEWSAERAWVSNQLKAAIVTQGRGVEKGDQVEAEQDPQVREAIAAIQLPTRASHQ
jgi:carboxyl-terminal processing protease